MTDADAIDYVQRAMGAMQNAAVQFSLMELGGGRWDAKVLNLSTGALCYWRSQPETRAEALSFAVADVLDMLRTDFDFPDLLAEGTALLGA